MSIKLTDTQRIMLSAAAQSHDRCLIAPKTLKGGAAQKVAAKLIAAGLVKETRAKAGAPVWRRNEHALRLTAAGAKAIGIDENRGSDEANDGNERAHAPPDIPPAEAGPTLSAPRNGAKLAQVIELLQRDRGATLDELVASTGWLPHTTRAALTGLRKRGFMVAMDRSDKQRGSTYRIRMDRAKASETEATGGSFVRRRTKSSGRRETGRSRRVAHRPATGSASNLERHHPVQNAARARCGTIGVGSPDPLEHLVKRVGVGEDLVGGLPVGVFVGVAKARDSQRRGVSERLAKVRRSGPA